MVYDFKNARNQRIAKERLAQALKRVKESAVYKDGTFSADVQSMVAQSMVPHLKKNSMKALHIYEAEHGGWHADLELRGMPPGVGRVLGTPVAMPCKTPAEAEAFGDHLISMILSIIERGTMTPIKPEIEDGSVTFFEFHGAEFALPVQALQALKESGRTGDTAYAVQRLKDMEDEYVFDGEFNDEKWDAAPREDQVIFLAVLGVAALHGYFRWPERKAAEPISDTRQQAERPGTPVPPFAAGLSHFRGVRH